MIKRFFYTVKQAFLQVLRNRAMSLASIFAITAMLLILSLFFILVINVNTAAQTIQQDYDSIEVYLKDDVTEEQADTIIDDLRTQDGVEDAYYKSKEDAMDEFKTRWGENGYLLNSLQENPLPNSVVIMIGDLEKADSLAQKAATYDGVEDVKFYKDTVDKLLGSNEVRSDRSHSGDDIPDNSIDSRRVEHDKAYGVQPCERDKHHEVCGSDELVHTGTVPG